MVSASNEQQINFPVLIADIGGTNARFSLLIDAYAEPTPFPVAQTADFPNIGEAIQQSVLDRTSVIPRSAILAIAAPVNSEKIPLTNNHWVIEPGALVDQLGLETVILVNDFEAQALATVTLSPEHLTQIGGETSLPFQNRVVLGPGTGLGVASMVNSNHVWIPVAGEGGHMDMGPRNAEEARIFDHISRLDGRVSGEHVLCGRGIVNLYNAVAANQGAQATYTQPSEITTAALAKTDPLAVETINMFATLLGRIAGDLALVFMAKGGVYLAGGISQKILPILQNGLLRAGFDNKAPHTRLLEKMPIYVITEPLAALSGLAAYARTPASFGIVTEGRRWQATS